MQSQTKENWIALEAVTSTPDFVDVPTPNQSASVESVIGRPANTAERQAIFAAWMEARNRSNMTRS